MKKLIASYQERKDIVSLEMLLDLIINEKRMTSQIKIPQLVQKMIHILSEWSSELDFECQRKRGGFIRNGIYKCILQKT